MNQPLIRGRDKLQVVMAGAFPPPVHGMAAVNAAVRDVLQRAGATPLVIDLAAPSLDRSLAARLGRLPRVLGGLGRLAGRRGLRHATLYMSVSGGLGQAYELAFILLARLRGMRLFLHHHSFAYLDRPGLLTRALVRAAGDDAAHVALSGGMAERLQTAYRADRVMPVSNAVFFVMADTPAVVRTRLETLGFLGNISAEKGAFEFLDLMAAAGKSGLTLRARLAGPFQDAATEKAVRERLASLPQVEYVGPQYGADKDAFYAGIDALIFPTRYVNEAEPVTVHEALSRGIPVIAYGRGCIPEIVGADCGLVIDPAEPFVPAALAKLESWLADPAAFEAASRAAAARFARTYDENEARWQALLAELTGAVAAPEPGSATGGGAK
ncbi:MAG: glycosyltransferase family 4 protein [Pseudomonadota bacterium]